MLVKRIETYVNEY